MLAMSSKRNTIIIVPSAACAIEMSLMLTSPMPCDTILYRLWGKYGTTCVSAVSGEGFSLLSETSSTASAIVPRIISTVTNSYKIQKIE